MLCHVVHVAERPDTWSNEVLCYIKTPGGAGYILPAFLYAVPSKALPECVIVVKENFSFKSVL